MHEFELKPGPRIIGGAGSIDRLGRLVAELGAQRVALVSDAGVRAAGHIDRAVDSLRAHRLTATIFDAVHENPTSLDVAAGADVLAAAPPELIVGLGGGSAMDCAKGISFILTNGGRMEDYWGYGKAATPLLPIVTIPTTAGTGSEVQSYALISHHESHAKMACGDPGALPQIAILDPQLLVTTPPRVAALAIVDAVSHAVESFVTVKRHRASMMFALEAFRHLAGAVMPWRDDPQNVATLSALQWGACLAGLAIENSMLGAAHALANPLTSVHGIVHGQAVGVMLPHVVRFNWSNCDAAYAELDRVLPKNGAWHGLNLAQALSQMLATLGLERDLRSLGIDLACIPQLANLAARQWTAQFNPRPLTESAARQLYGEAFPSIVAKPNIG